jgi:hypothetical protein
MVDFSIKLRRIHFNPNGNSSVKKTGIVIKKYSLDSASSVQAAINGLNEKEIISNTNNEIKVYDYFFGWWVRNRY